MKRALVFFLGALLGAPAALQAQFDYTTANGTVTITSYTGPHGPVTIPGTIEGLPVTAIGNNAFINDTNITSVTMPDSIVYIGESAFANCTELTDVSIGSGVTILGAFPKSATQGLSGFTIPNAVTNLGEDVFAFRDLTNVTVPPGVTNLGSSAFYIHFAAGGGDNSLAIGSGAFVCDVKLGAVQIQNNVSSIGDGAFYFCTSLSAIRFMGDAPSPGLNVFASDNATVYYLPGTAGWSTNFADLPTAEGVTQYPVILTGHGLGAGYNGFGFIVSWVNNAFVTVDVCTNLAGPAWIPLETKTLTGGASYFSDPEWGSDSPRFYRVHSP